MTKLFEFVGDYPVLGQNFNNNDLVWIHEHLDTLGMKTWSPTEIVELRTLYNGVSLKSIAEKLNLEFKDEHDAFEDAYVTMQAYESCKKE